MPSVWTGSPAGSASGTPPTAAPASSKRSGKLRGACEPKNGITVKPVLSKLAFHAVPIAHSGSSARGRSNSTRCWGRWPARWAS
jgi:hypothetical protein